MRETPLSKLGESRVLRAFMPIINAHNEQVAAAARQAGRIEPLEVGPGDDCAVLAEPAPGQRTVVTTDTLVEDQDFMNLWPGGIARAGEDGEFNLEPARSSGYDVGRKAATQNLADVAAMGARPASLFISLSLPGSTPYGWIDGFAHGIVDGINACGATECVIGGGDIGDSTEMSVTVTALGYTDRAVLRSGARPGDTIALAGRTAWSDAGLRLLLNPLSLPATALLRAIAAGQDAEAALGAVAQAWAQKQAEKSGEDSAALPEGLIELALTLTPEDAAHMLAVCERAVDSQHHPVSPIPAGEVARQHRASSMLDLSDGLVKDAGRVAAASGVQMRLDRAAVDAFAEPLLPLARLLLVIGERNEVGESPASLARTFVLVGGEDHGLLATFPGDVPEEFVPLGTCVADAPERGLSAELYGSERRHDTVTGAAVVMDGRSLDGMGWEHYGASA
ncbi:thiamine-monophosphate kinase [Rothia sp. HMSC069C04]|uniref:thiamine-phosphate kinase n=1 Tax=Rothia sp. HMSC069C04 TaxID=1739383 RepID=UPI0008A41D8A|nr:AIR synthase related protein [Rothia sp. HMSC069C04]OFR60543.1 thiamine-monophosphate kinase [Rothia sp. HMSC069C04]